MQRLAGKIGIRHKPPGDLYDIRLPRPDDLLHLRRVVQGTDTGNRLADIFLNIGRQVNIDPSREKCIRVCPAEHCGILMVPAGNLKQVHLVLDQLRHLHARIHVQPHVRQVIT